MEIVDVSNPYSPFIQFVIYVAYEIRTVAQYESNIVFAEYGNALSLWSVADPWNPYQTDYIPVIGNEIEECFTTQTGDVYFADGSQGIQIYRINQTLGSDP